MLWQYGVTTVPARVGNELPKTLESLKIAGFDAPRLFVDGCEDPYPMFKHFGLPITSRSDPVLTAGNWVLSLYELWARNALADRYAIFQDDLVACVGMREYLESCHYPEKGYWNLYTVPMNQVLAPKNDAKGTVDGWFLSNQLGKGALALVFDGPAVRNLLGQEYLVDRFLTRDPDPYMRKRLVDSGHSNEEAEAMSRRCDRKIDGGIVDAMKRRGWAEWCHSPSLVDHTGDESTMNNKHRVGGNGYGRAESFRGEGWDARTLVK